VWDIKYRPVLFSEVLGQDGNAHLLKSRLRNGSAFDTSYIFAGGHGQGKTTLARIYARAMLCLDRSKEDPEPCNQCDNCTSILAEDPGAFSERDAASQGTIEHIRAIVDELPFSILNAPKRIYLFDEAHRMSPGAQDVLLKPIEEKKMVGVFCTTEPEKIRGPIRSRCEEYTIRKVTREDVLGRMRSVLERESVESTDDAILIVIDHSGGHVRDVLNKLEMISQIGPITVENVREHLKLGVVSTYYEILLSLSEPKKAIELVEQACERVSSEDVAAGIAEAAMNSYRLANGMFADFVYVDRELGHKVWSAYGAHVVRFADWFLRARYPSSIGLIRDIVVLSESPNYTPPKGAPPPVVFATGVAPAQVASAPQASTPAAPAASMTPTTPAAAVETPAAPVEATPVAEPVSAANELQNYDPPLTSVDAKLNLEKPRMASQVEKSLSIPGRGNITDDRRIMLPEEWRRDFRDGWPGGPNGGSSG